MPMCNHRLTACVTIAAGCLVAATGCGPARGDLGGTVTYQGQPVRSGSVTVLGGDGIPRTDAIREDGTYLVQNIAPGPVKIAVASPDPARAHLHTRKSGSAISPITRPGWFAIPDDYGDFNKSGLSVQLTAGRNTYAIELK